MYTFKEDQDKERIHSRSHSLVPVFGQKIVSAALRQIVLSDLTAVAANFSCDLLRFFIYVTLWASILQKPSYLVMICKQNRQRILFS